MYWRKSCACYRNWKSSLHGSRWLILIGFLKIIVCRLPELSIYKGRLKSKKAAYTTCFSCKTLNPSHPVLSPRGRELERGQQAARLVFGQLGYCERLPQFGECPLPNPPPRGRERVTAGFAVTGSLKRNLGLQPLISGRLKNKKQPAQPVFLAEPFIPTATPSSLPWERARERATSRKACIEAVRVFGKVAAIRRMPSPQPSPTGGGAGCSRFRRCRSSEKECPKHQRQEFFR